MWSRTSLGTQVRKENMYAYIYSVCVFGGGRGGFVTPAIWSNHPNCPSVRVPFKDHLYINLLSHLNYYHHHMNILAKHYAKYIYLSWSYQQRGYWFDQFFCKVILQGNLQNGSFESLGDGPHMHPFFHKMRDLYLKSPCICRQVKENYRRLQPWIYSLWFLRIRKTNKKRLSTTLK